MELLSLVDCDFVQSVDVMPSSTNFFLPLGIRPVSLLVSITLPLSPSPLLNGLALLLIILVTHRGRIPVPSSETVLLLAVVSFSAFPIGPFLVVLTSALVAHCGHLVG